MVGRWIYYHHEDVCWYDGEKNAELVQKQEELELIRPCKWIFFLSPLFTSYSSFLSWFLVSKWTIITITNSQYHDESITSSFPSVKFETTSDVSPPPRLSWAIFLLEDPSQLDWSLLLSTVVLPRDKRLQSCRYTCRESHLWNQAELRFIPPLGILRRILKLTACTTMMPSLLAVWRLRKVKEHIGECCTNGFSSFRVS